MEHAARSAGAGQDRHAGAAAGEPVWHDGLGAHRGTDGGRLTGMLHVTGHERARVDWAGTCQQCTILEICGAWRACLPISPAAVTKCYVHALTEHRFVSFWVNTVEPMSVLSIPHWRLTGSWLPSKDAPCIHIASSAQPNDSIAEAASPWGIDWPGV